MTLKDLGYNEKLAAYRRDNNLDSFEVGRVISEHKERYLVRTAETELEAELIGNLRFSSQSREDFPAVGDWVALTLYDDNKALIHAIFPRHSILERQAVGKFGKKQIIATNIDFGLIVQAIDRDFIINRLERYLTICNSATVKPIIVISKIDLIDEKKLSISISKIKSRMPDIPLIAISSINNQGYDKIISLIKPGFTYCLLGSSGVGKSTLLNNISGQEVMQTGSINENIGRGKHVTSHRELVLMENGAILIDNPGMREVGIADEGMGLEQTFEKILDEAQYCKFKDCTHIHEKGCAVLEAVEKNEIDSHSYENYLKMKKEKRHFEESVVEKRKKDKQFGKLIKNIVKNKQQNRFG
jgi:ribosome biogenesis GTPase